MIREIHARTLLASHKNPDHLFGLKYNLNLYRGCEHQCIYCDSRSACYGIENFADVLVKVNAIDLLHKELPTKRIRGVIGFGSMSDPYTPIESQYNLTGRALAVISQYAFPVHINTKSDLILKDLPILTAINRIFASVCFTITTTDDTLAARVEPFAPPPSARLRAMQQLAQAGIRVGVTMMPILPFVEDSPANIESIVEQTAAHGGTFILPWMGMSMRKGQREYFYAQLDRLFPGLRASYQHQYGERYECLSPHAAQLYRVFQNNCQRYGIADHIPPYQPARQLSLWQA